MSKYLVRTGLVLLVALSGYVFFTVGPFPSRGDSPSETVDPSLPLDSSLAVPAPTPSHIARPQSPSTTRPLSLSASPPAAATAPAAGHDSETDTSTRSENDLMVFLKDHLFTDPTAVLKHARAGNERFPDSPRVPERHWYIVRSHVELQQFEQAIRETRLLMKRHPESPFTRDARRHLLSHPIDLSSHDTSTDKSP